MPDERKDLTTPPERTEPYTPQEAEDLRKLLEAIGALEQSTNRQIGTLATCIRASFLGLSGLHERVFYAERALKKLEATLEGLASEVWDESEERKEAEQKLVDQIDNEASRRRDDVAELERRVGNVEDDVARIER